MDLQVLESFDSVSLDGFAGGLGLEHARLLREGIDALALLGSGALLDNEAGHAWNNKLAALLELTLTNGSEGFCKKTENNVGVLTKQKFC